MPIHHSLPGSTNIIYIDFDGEVVQNTDWNSVEEIPVWNCRPYTIDADESTFSIAEQRAMSYIWSRMSEDYSPFDVDVTTEKPVAYTRTTAHCLITSSTDANNITLPSGTTAGGIAYLNTFGNWDFAK